MSTTQLIVVASVGTYLLLGFLYGLRAVSRLKRSLNHMAEKTGLPPELLKSRAVVLPVLAVCTFLWVPEILTVLWKRRKQIRHSLLGYWPVIASSANLIAHWNARRQELHDALGCELFGFIDTHMDETAYYLEKQGVDVRNKDWQPGEISQEDLEDLQRMAAEAKEESDE